METRIGETKEEPCGCIHASMGKTAGYGCSINVDLVGRGKSSVLCESTKKARRSIDIEQIKFNSFSTKSTMSGGKVIQISGRNAGEKANELANKLAEILEDEVNIKRLQKSAEIIINMIEESVTIDEITSVLARMGGCLPEKIETGTIRRHNENGLCSVWTRLPIYIYIYERGVTSSGCART